MSVYYRQDLQTFRLFNAELKNTDLKVDQVAAKYLPLMNKQESQKVLNEFAKSRSGFINLSSQESSYKKAFNTLYKNAGIKSGTLHPKTYERLLSSEVSMAKSGIIHPEVQEAYKEIKSLQKQVNKLSENLEKVTKFYENLVGNLKLKENMSAEKIAQYSNNAPIVEKAQKNDKVVKKAVKRDNDKGLSR